MKVPLRYCRIFMHLSMGLLLVVFLWALLALVRSDDLQQDVAARGSTRAVLARLEEEAQWLEERSERWAVSGAMSFEIRQTITSALRDAAFTDPVLIGSHRLHKASLRISEEPAESSFAALSALQGLPIRVLAIDLTVDRQGRVSGAIDVAWLERI